MESAELGSSQRGTDQFTQHNKLPQAAKETTLPEHWQAWKTERQSLVMENELRKTDETIFHGRIIALTHTKKEDRAYATPYVRCSQPPANDCVTGSGGGTEIHNWN